MVQKKKLARYGMLLSGAFILAFGLFNVHSQSRITEGGVLGATLLLRHWFGISPAITSFLLNGVCYALGWRTLGKTFLAYSALSICTYSISYAVWEQFPPLWPRIGEYPLLAAVAGALFIGIGAGLCVKAGGATAGDDALAMSISHIAKIDIQWVYLVTDLVVLLLSLSYIPFQRIFYSLLTVTLSSKLIGWVQRFHFSKKEANT